MQMYLTRHANETLLYTYNEAVEGIRYKQACCYDILVTSSKAFLYFFLLLASVAIV